MEFTKISHSPTKNRTEIHYTQPEKKGSSDTKYKSKDLPRPELYKALQSFAPTVIDMLGLPETYAKNLEVRSVSLKGGAVNEDGEDDGAESPGIVISAVKTIEGMSRPFNISTPFCQPPKDEDGEGFWPDDLDKKIEKLKKEAKRFMDGDRAQQELPLPEGAPQ